MMSNQISYRMRPRGGAARDTPIGCPILTGNHALVFVHGHNVSEFGAEIQWRTLSGLLQLQDAQRIVALPLVWPSDRFMSRTLSKATFRYSSEQARKIGRRTGDFLASKQAASYTLVGHSLGAAVALEATQRLLLAKKRVGGLVLLGAAVADVDLEPDGMYGFTPMAEREIVSYCPSDVVLRKAFVAGQIVASRALTRREAVGLHGNPRQRGWIVTYMPEATEHRHWRYRNSARLIEAALTGAGLTQSLREPNTRNATERFVSGEEPAR